MAITDTPIFRDTIVNLRDLTGICTKSNAKIKEGVLFRSANPSWSSDEDKTFLKTLNLAHIVDFRSEQEKKQILEAPFVKKFPVNPQPIAFGDVMSDRILHKVKHLSKKDVHDYMCYLNLLFVTDYQTQFAAFLSLATQGKPILFHCTAGKDRTGFATLLLLSALEVDEDIIMANYLESNLYTHSIFQESDQHAKQLGMDLDVYKLFQQVTEDYLHTAQKTIKNDFQGMEHYLRCILNVDMNSIQKNCLE